MVTQGGWPRAATAMIASLCLAATQVAFAQASPQCALAGTVFNSATNAPIPHALVTFFGSATGFRFTDAGGNFRVDGIPCGEHRISVSKAGFVSEEDLSGPRNAPALLLQEAAGDEEDEQLPLSPQPAEQTVDIKPGSLPVRILLVPVSSIAGSVRDENGEPLPGVVLQAITVKASLDGTDYVPAKTANTDDRGRYSLLTLLPGDYIVRLAGEVSATSYFLGTRLSLSNDHRGMQPVYYPNVEAQSSAQVIHLGGGERASIDFQHATEPAFDINGRLGGFLPQVWTRMQLYREGDRLPLGRAYVNPSSGQFRVLDVPRGQYTLRTVQYQAEPPLWLAAETPVMITSEPIENLQVELARGIDIPVSVSYEAGAQAGGRVHLDLRSLRTADDNRSLTLGMIQEKAFGSDLGQQDRDVQSVSPEAPVLSDVLPDRYRLKVNMRGNDYVASGRLGDLEILHGEFTVSGGSAGELRLTIRGDSASVEGKVTFQGQPAIEASVYLMPTSRDTSKPKFGLSDQKGHFQISGVPPGDYRLRAWRGEPAPENPLSSPGNTLTLQPNEHRTVTLEAAPGNDPPAKPPQ